MSCARDISVTFAYSILISLQAEFFRCDNRSEFRARSHTECSETTDFVFLHNSEQAAQGLWSTTGSASATIKAFSLMINKPIEVGKTGLVLVCVLDQRS